MKRIISLLAAVLISAAMLAGCGHNDSLDSASSSEQTTAKQPPQTLTWSELTPNGIDEKQLFENLDADVLKEVASELQALTQEIVAKQREQPDSVLRGDWAKDVVNSPRYKRVTAMGDKAQKPLYFIIYKSGESGLYEYICALALEELSGFDFDEDGDGAKWSNAQEFLSELNTKILEQQKNIDK